MAKSLKNMMGAGIGAGTATLINGTVADGLTATGSNQSDALILTSDVNVVSTVPVGSGVRLLAVPQPGDEVLISNLGANALAVYPPIGATISGAAVNSPFSLPAGAASEFVARKGSANWVALSSGSSGGGGGGGGGTLGAPTLGYPSPISSNPASIAVHIPVDWQSGVDALKLALSASSAMTSPTILSHTINDTDITNGTATVSIPTLAAETYFQAYGSHSGADSSNLSNIVAWGDTTAPTITTSASQSNTETNQLAIALAATDTGGVPAVVSDGIVPGWYIDSGADQLQYEVAIVAGSPVLRWIGNGVQTYTAPADQDANNTYLVTVGAIDYSGNKVTKAITTTVAIGPPTLSSPVANPGATTATLGVNSNQGTGTLYWVVSTSATPPSAAQIIAGHDSSGGAGAAQGSQAVSATGAQTVSVTGLTISTNYYAYFAQVNAGAQTSAVVGTAQFTTLAAAASLVIGAGAVSGSFPGTPYTFTAVHLGAGLAHVFIHRDYDHPVTSVIARKAGQTDVTLTKTYTLSPTTDCWTGVILVDASDWTLIVADATDSPVGWAILPITVVGANNTPTQTDVEVFAGGLSSPFAGATNFTIAGGGVAFRFLNTIGNASTAVTVTPTDGALPLATFNYTNFDGNKCQIVAAQMTANGTVSFTTVPTTPNTPIQLIALDYNHA